MLLLLAPALLPGQDHADCGSAFFICDSTLYFVPKPAGEGRDTTEADHVVCFMNGDQYGMAEKNSTWVRFRVDTSGTVLFTLTPYIETDDLDFVLYRLPEGDCAKKKIVRCMAAGDKPGNPKSPCLGATGLAHSEHDVQEDAGCADAGDNAWLAPLRAKAGEHYVLLISNLSSNAGYYFRFSGTAAMAIEP